MTSIGAVLPTTSRVVEVPGASPTRDVAAAPLAPADAAEAITPNASPASETASPRRVRRARALRPAGRGAARPA